MGYKIYVKADRKGMLSRFEQWDAKTYALRSNAQKALMKAKQKVKDDQKKGSTFFKGAKVTWEIRSDGKTMKKKPARRGGFTGEGFGSPLGTTKFRGFM